MASQLDIAFLTDPGRARNINCDRCVTADREALGNRADAFLMVADGMGANRRGDTASLIAAEVLPTTLVQTLRELPDSPTQEQLAQALRDATAAANLAVWKRAQEDPDLRGMGTTCVAALVTGGTVLICHAGDSRAYLLSDGAMSQITADHSLIQEVVTGDDVGVEGRFGTVITRGIGLSRTVDADLELTRLGPRDALLLCTDGLTNMVRDRRIAAVLAEAPTASDACIRLVAEANSAGGVDNIGVAVCRGAEYVPYQVAAGNDVEAAVPADDTRSSPRRRRRSRSPWPTALAMALAALCMVLAVLLFLSVSERNRLAEEVRLLKATK
ncbi:MAG: serine/threonine-protein phosphatase [Chthonomonadales bacterium]|nr:serine/threonine-protein phosphatase [Chthonomonadales bacterium]